MRVSYKGSEVQHENSSAVKASARMCDPRGVCSVMAVTRKRPGAMSPNLLDSPQENRLK
jgi:hypothetical protein